MQATIMDKQKSNEKLRRKFFKISNVNMEGDMLGCYFLKNDEPYSFSLGNFSAYYKVMRRANDMIFQATSKESAIKMFYNRVLDNAEPILLEQNLLDRKLVERDYYLQFLTFDIEQVTVQHQLDGSFRDQNQPSRVIEHDYIIINNQI